MAVGVHSGDAGSTSGAFQFTSTSKSPAAGSTLIACGGFFGDSFDATTPISDTRGNTWTLLGSDLAFGGYHYRTYKAVNITGGAGTVTIKGTGSGSAAILFVTEATSAPAAPTVLENQANDTATAYTSGTIAPATATTLLGFFFSDASSGTETDTWGGSFASGDKLDASTNANSFICGSSAGNSQSAGGTWQSSVTVSGVTVTSTGVFVVSVESTSGAAQNVLMWIKA